MNKKKLIETIIHNTVDDLSGFTAAQMGIHYDLALSREALNLSFKTAFPSGLLKKSYFETMKQAIEEALPDLNVYLSIEPFIKAHQTQLPGKALRGVKNTIAIASGKGGVGKSTVAVNLAVSLAKQGARVGILDADIYGPSIPLMLGKTSAIEVEGEHYKPALAHDLQAMSIGYLTDNEQALIWRGPMLAKSLLQMINITLWDELDYLIIDLPPGTGDIQLSLVQKIPLTAAIVVTTPQNVATLDAQKAITMFNKTGIHVLGIIENMSFHVCKQCDHQEHIFGHGGAEALCQSKHIPLLGSLPLHSQIRALADKGEPAASLQNSALDDAFDASALRTAIELSKRPINYAGKFPDINVE